MSDLERRPTAEIVDPADLRAATTDELKGRLTSILARTADDLRVMATIVAELEERGEDLVALRLGIVDHLRRIAAGQLLPEVLVRCSGYPALLRIAATLPLPDQRRIASGDPLPLAVWREGRIDWRRVDPLGLTATQLRQVFASDRIRTETEQVGLLEARAEEPPKPAPKPKRARVRADAERGGIVVGRAFASLDDVLAALAQLADADYEDDDAGDEHKLVVPLAAPEHRQLKIRAAKCREGMATLVRRAMAAGGLIRRREET